MNIISETEKACGFKTSFGTVIRSTEIAVYIVITHYNHRPEYGVYICHGVAGGAFWKNSAPLVRCESLEKAQDTAETIFGIYGSGKFAEIIDQA
jgi:hypothetical protein